MPGDDVHYLVIFVADPAGDEHADALREVARTIGGAGFFDGDADDPQRTVGTFVRVAGLDDPAVSALIEAVGTVSARLRTRFEVQFREEVLGHLHDGAPDARLAGALPGDDAD